MKILILFCLFICSTVSANEGIKCLERTTDVVLAVQQSGLYYAAMYGENGYLKHCSELNGDDLESLEALFEMKKTVFSAAIKEFKESGRLKKSLYEKLAYDETIKQETIDSKLICSQLDKHLNEKINLGFGNPEKCGKEVRAEILSINFSKLSIQESCNQILPLLKQLREIELKCDE